MANNSQYTGGPGPPLHPSMAGSIAPPPNIPPPMPSQFRPVAPIYPSQQFAPPASQQYPSLAGIPAMNLGVAPSQTQQMQFAQPIPQAPPRPILQGHLTPMSQSMPFSNIQINRPISSGLPQAGQNLQAQSSFPPVSGGVGMHVPPAYAPNAFPAQYQIVSQVNIHSNLASGPPLMVTGNQGVASFTPVQMPGQPSPSVTINSAADSHPKPLVQSSDWLEHINNGRRFYYNKKTRQSTWEKPSELMTPIERADATTDWKEYSSPDGRKYYFNKVTRQSKWTIPEELKLAREQAEKASCITEVNGDAHALASASISDVRTPSNADNPVVHSSPVVVTPGSGPANSPTSSSPRLASLPRRDPREQTDAVEVHLPAETLSGAAEPGTVDLHVAPGDNAVLPMSNSVALSAEETLESLQNVRVQDDEETSKSTSISEKTNVSTPEEKAIEHQTPTYASKQEAKEAFKALLEHANVESDWTWEQAMRLIINDKRYGALRSLGERKQAFSEYLSQKRKQEAEERRARNKKVREDFRKMLEECCELTSTTRWSKAVNIFGSDERFIAIERARDREDMFEEYLVEREKKIQAKAEEDHLRHIMEYRKFLESCDFIKGDSQWRRVKDRLEADERCSRLETIDQLKIFQEYVGDLEKEEEEQRRIRKEEIRKAERKNRDEFRKLMEEHVSDGTLTANTLWREYHSKVKDLPAYLAVSSNSSGTTPKELFDDVAEELKKQYQEDRTRIKDAVKSEKVSLSSTWTLEDFKAAIANEISSSAVSENNLKLVFEELLERVREKEEKEAKRRKRLGDEFFNMLCLLKDITVDSQWEDSLPLFQARDEFRSIGDELFSKQIFEEFLEQLKEKEEQEQKRKEEKAKKEKERERRSKDKREKERRHDRDREKERSGKDEGDAERHLNEVSVSNENRRSGRDKDRKHRKRHQDDENDTSLDTNGKDHSRSSHRHSSERKKSRHTEHFADMPESDNESKHKKHKREHRNGSRRKGDNEELEDGELGNW